MRVRSISTTNFLPLLQRLLVASLTSLCLNIIALPSTAGDAVILVSGGPGIFDGGNPDCDPRWDSYIAAPLGQTILRPPKVGITPPHQFFWLVFKPAYDARWKADQLGDDVRQAQVADVKNAGFESYTDLIDARAKERRWIRIWINSEAEFWQALENIQVPVDEFYYWGHANDDLWLTVEHRHDSQSKQVSIEAPPRQYVISRRDISKHHGIQRLFTGQFLQAPVFYGNNTAPFAQLWANQIRVTSVGTEGAVDFSQVGSNDGKVLLAKPRHGAPAARFVVCQPD